MKCKTFELIMVVTFLLANFLNPVTGGELSHSEQFPVGVNPGDTIDLYLQEYTQQNYDIRSWDELKKGDLTFQYQVLNITDESIVLNYLNWIGQTINQTLQDAYPITLDFRYSYIGQPVIHLNFSLLKESFEEEYNELAKDHDTPLKRGSDTSTFSFVLIEDPNEIGLTFKKSIPLNLNNQSIYKERYIEHTMINDKHTGKLIHWHDKTEDVFLNDSKRSTSFTVAALGYFYDQNSDSINISLYPISGFSVVAIFVILKSKRNHIDIQNNR